MSDNPFLDAALAAADRGWRVFPGRSRREEPGVQALAAAGDGRSPAAPLLVARGRSMERRHRDRRVEAARGRPRSGARRHRPARFNGAQHGSDVLAMLAAEAGAVEPTDTYTVATPSGGRHLYFRAPGRRRASVDRRHVGLADRYPRPRRRRRRRGLSERGRALQADPRPTGSGAARVAGSGSHSGTAASAGAAVAAIGRSREQIRPGRRDERDHRGEGGRGRATGTTPSSARRGRLAGWSVAESWPRPRRGRRCCSLPRSTSASTAGPPRRANGRSKTVLPSGCTGLAGSAGPAALGYRRQGKAWADDGC